MTLQVISFKDACRAGKKRYFTGVPCKNGHLAERFVCRKTCVVCDMTTKKANYAKSPKVRASQKLRARRWYLANKSKADEASRLWSEQHPEAVAARFAKRRAALRKAIPPWADLKAIKGIYFVARERTRVTGLEHHVDHIVPLQGGNVCGLHTQNNLCVLLGKLNQSKGNRLDLFYA